MGRPDRRRLRVLERLALKRLCQVGEGMARHSTRTVLVLGQQLSLALERILSPIGALMIRIGFWGFLIITIAPKPYSNY